MSGCNFYYQKSCQSRFSGMYLVFEVFQDTWHSNKENPSENPVWSLNGLKLCKLAFRSDLVLISLPGKVLGRVSKACCNTVKRSIPSRHEEVTHAPGQSQADAHSSVPCMNAVQARIDNVENGINCLELARRVKATVLIPTLLRNTCAAAWLMQLPSLLSSDGWSRLQHMFGALL